MTANFCISSRGEKFQERESRKTRFHFFATTCNGFETKRNDIMNETLNGKNGNWERWREREERGFVCQSIKSADGNICWLSQESLFTEIYTFLHTFFSSVFVSFLFIDISRFIKIRGNIVSDVNLKRLFMWLNSMQKNSKVQYSTNCSEAINS